ncbi:hypothetical protein [Streptomyces sp. NPDC093589]|uniref:hypothetical protein n=1 Tax=Streptomyces sp. NPDC093589 TaxID=3366043 RepID=UPI00381A9E4B
MAGIKVDQAALLEQMHRWGRQSREMQSITKSLHAVHGAKTADEIAARLVTSVLMRVVGVHESRLTAAGKKMQEVLDRLLADRAVLHGGEGPVRGRAVKEADLHTLQSQLQELRTFQQTVQELLTDAENDFRTSLRTQLETSMGLPRSHAPLPAPGTPAVRPSMPRLAPVVGKPAADAAARLFTALETRPPKPVAPTLTGPGSHAPAKHYKAREMGRQSRPVTTAAKKFVAAFRAEHGNRAVAVAIKALLTGTDDMAERNRMVIAVLIAEDRLRPGKAVPRGTAHGRYQERGTGTSFEWTAKLQQWVRGFETVGIDGIVGGWVRDTKHIQVGVAESGHFHGRLKPPTPLPDKPPAAPHGSPKPDPKPKPKPAAKAGKGRKRPRPKAESDEIQGGFARRDRPWEEDVTPNVATGLRKPPQVTARELIALHEEKTGITLAAEMERQLLFAHENGLRGVEWVAATPELRAEFERVFSSQVGNPQPDVMMAFTVESH